MSRPAPEPHKEVRTYLTRRRMSERKARVFDPTVGNARHVRNVPGRKDKREGCRVDRQFNVS